MCDCVVLACCGACALALFLAGLYLTFGIIFITLAARAKSAISTHQVLITDDLSLYPNLCIAIGVFFTLLTAMALIGQRNGKKTRIVYAVAQVLVLAMGIYIYAAAYPDPAKVEEHIFRGLNGTIHKYGGNMTGSKNITFEWDILQENLECCGVKNYQDWENMNLGAGIPTPISCCRSDHRMRECSKHVRFDHPADANKLIYVQGCLPQVRSEILGRMGILNYFLAPILVTTAFGCLAACCSSGVKKGDEEFEEKKVGPIVVRTNTKKKKAIKDVENPDETPAADSPAEGDGTSKDKPDSKYVLASSETPAREPAAGDSKTPV